MRKLKQTYKKKQQRSLPLLKPLPMLRLRNKRIWISLPKAHRLKKYLQVEFLNFKMSFVFIELFILKRSLTIIWVIAILKSFAAWSPKKVR